MKVWVWLIMCLLVTASYGQKAEEIFAEAQALEQENPEKAFQQATESYRKAKEEGNEALLVEVQRFFGKMLFDQGAFHQSLENYLAAHKSLEKQGQSEVLIQNTLSIARVYYYLKQPDKSLDLAKQALAQSESSSQDILKAESLEWIGHLYEKVADYEAALAHQQTAKKIYQGKRNHKGLAKVYDNIGSILEDQEEYAIARLWFDSARAINVRLKDEVALCGNLNNLGDSYRKVGENDSALYYTQQALQLAKEHELHYQKSAAWRDLGKTYVQVGKYEWAYTYLDSSRELYEELYSDESRRQAALLQTLYEVEKKNNAIQQLENQQKIDTIQTRLALVCLVLAAVFVWIVVSRQRLKMKKNEELLKKENDLQKAVIKNSELESGKLKIELEHKQLEEKHLQLELETQQKVLSSRLLQLIEKNKLLEDLKKDIQGLSEGLKDKHQKQIQYIVNQINFSFNHDKDWEDFRKSFEQIHQAFFSSLQKISPELTANDLRICALMRINLSSKDIASLLGITTDSLRVSRYRLRKKLNIAEGENFRKFILNI